MSMSLDPQMIAILDIKIFYSFRVATLSMYFILTLLFLHLHVFIIAFFNCAKIPILLSCFNLPSTKS